MSNTTLKVVSILISLLWLPLHLYYDWLILGKINAGDTLYLLFWISIPIAIISTLISWLIRDSD